jgi:hypothetical protein
VKQELRDCDEEKSVDLLRFVTAVVRKLKIEPAAVNESTYDWTPRPPKLEFPGFQSIPSHRNHRDLRTAKYDLFQAAKVPSSRCQDNVHRGMTLYCRLRLIRNWKRFGQGLDLCLQFAEAGVASAGLGQFDHAANFHRSVA